MLTSMRGTFQKLLILSALLLAAFTTRVQADETVIWDFDDGFSPSTVVISPGEKVTWVNLDVYGFSVRITVTGYQPFTLGPGQAVFGIFNTLGTYSMSSDWGDSGSVFVTVPPTVTITNPVNNAVFSAPATFQIETSTSDNASYAWFYLDSGSGPELLDYDFEPPFSYGLTNLAAGSYILTATVTDNYSEASDSISITVSEVASVITLSNPRLSDAGFLFDVSGLTAGKTHVLQHSTNCAVWTAIATNVATSSTHTLTNSAATSGRFYRVLELAAPGP
jgi:plastocyanin